MTRAEKIKAIGDWINRDTQFEWTDAGTIWCGDSNDSIDIAALVDFLATLSAEADMLAALQAIKAVLPELSYEGRGPLGVQEAEAAIDAAIAKATGAGT